MTKEEIIIKFKKFVEINNRIPFYNEFNEINNLPKIDHIRKHYNSYTNFLKENGYETRRDNIKFQYLKKLSKEKIENLLLEKIEKNEIKNTKDFNKIKDFPSWETFSNLLKMSWNNFLIKINREDLILKKIYSKEDLIEEYKKLLKNEKKRITINTFEKKTGISHKTINFHFISWRNFLKEFNLSFNFTTTKKTDDELISDYIKLSEELGKEIKGATAKDINENLEVTSDIYFKRFKNISHLKKICGYDLSSRDIYTEEYLIEVLKKEIEKKGTLLISKDFNSLNNLPSLSTYRRYFKFKSLKEFQIDKL